MKSSVTGIRLVGVRKFILLGFALIAGMALYAEVACSFEGATMNVVAPSTHKGCRLVLLWDTKDKGDNPAAWANAHEIATEVPAGGARYAVDLDALGIANGTPCRIAVYERYRLLDKLQMTSKQCYIDTGFKDTEVYGVRFGFYGNSGAAANWNFIIGSGEGGTSVRGFVVGENSSNYASWYWTYTGFRAEGSDRASVYTDAINEAAFTNSMFTLNGRVVKSGLAAGPVGMLATNMCIGTAKNNNNNARYHYGWWSHVSFDGTNGVALLDYIPVQRCSDDRVGFFDRVTSTFVTSTGGGAFTAGSVTNGSIEALGLMKRVTPNHMMSLEVSGLKLYAKVPAGLAGEQLMLAWGDGDKGGDINDWPNSVEVVPVVGKDGGMFVADLVRLGVRNGQTCRVFARHNLQLLDMLQMPDNTTFIDTGVKDNACYGVRFGFYGTGKSAAFGNIIGTDDAGFTVGANNDAITSWYWCYRGVKDSPRPTVKTDSINDVSFMNQTFTANGSVVKSGLAAGAVGESGRNMYIGTYALINRFLYGWWSYARFDDAGGNAIIDYVPAKRTGDGKVGFLDRATGAFVLSTGGGDFTAGTETNASFTACHLWRSVSLADVVATATWTGLGTAGALDDPANWTCTNLYGEVVSGLPNEFTAVTIPSAADFSCPEGSAFSCQTLSVGGALASDRDWRGVDFAKVSGSIDLAGHALRTTALSDMARVAEVTDTVGGGALYVETAPSSVVSNTAVAFTGAMKLVKEGDGRFVAAKAGQTYSGGTDVVGGTFACGGNGTNGVYGVAGTTNMVFAGATFDCNNFGEHWQYPFVLAGGTLRDPWRVADITLTDDSFIEETIISRPALANMNFAEATLEMNGHTLAFDIAAGKACALVNLTVTGGGTILGRSGGYLRMGYTDAAGVRASGTVLDIRHSLRVDAETTFLDYISRYVLGGYDTGASNPIKVVRRFCPTRDDMRWHSVELQDGAILDLSQVTGIWNATSHGDHFDGTSTLSFAPGATITVDMGERTVELNDQLTAWTTKPQNVTFTWDRPLPLCALRAGLFVKRDPGMTIIFR